MTAVEFLVEFRVALQRRVPILAIAIEVALVWKQAPTKEHPAGRWMMDCPICTALHAVGAIVFPAADTFICLWCETTGDAVTLVQLCLKCDADGALLYVKEWDWVNVLHDPRTSHTNWVQLPALHVDGPVC